MAILVLGGAGYIGSHTVHELIEAGRDVVVADNLLTGFRAAVHPKARFYQLDIRDRAALDVLFQAAKIDGANAWQSFKSITMPYILFITGPSLVNSLVANINNFNVIWLLSRDVYTTSDQLMANANANEVDLLVTWLYRLTQDQSNYKMASVIGILVFVVCAILTLVAFSRMIKGDKEESFQ